MKVSASLLAVLLLFCLIKPLHAQAPEYRNAPRQMLRVEARALNQSTMQKFFALDLDVAEFNHAQNAFEVIATQDDRAQLADLGVSYTTLNANLETFALSLRAQNYLDHFHDYAETLAELQLAEAFYPALAKLVDIGDSWEKTQGLADRDIWAIKISDNVQEEENEAEALIIGNHHAREIITPEIVLDFMNYLLQNYGSESYVTHLVNHRQIWLIPTLNPDGLDYVHQQDLWWRKNRRRNAGGSFGVDLNRNYEFKWGYDNIGSSSNGNSGTYRGTAPFSEPETAALRDFVNAHRFRASLSYHSYGNLLIYPWGYIPQHTPDHASFVALADSMVAYHGYHAGLGVETVGYSVNGEADDWFYGEQTTKNKIFSMTPEVGNAFHPDTAEIAQLILENRGPNLFLTYAVGEEPIVAHEPLGDITFAASYQIVAQVLPPIVFTEPVALARDKVLLHYNATGVPPFATVVMNTTGNAQEFAAEIPTISGALRIYYFTSAEDDSGRVGYAPRGASAGEYFSFATTAVTEHETSSLPQTIALHQSRPNPFHEATSIQYELPAGFSGEIKLAIYNLIGQQVRVLVQRGHRAGYYRAQWEGKDELGNLVPAGIYFYRLEGKGYVEVKKLVLMR